LFIAYAKQLPEAGAEADVRINLVDCPVFKGIWWLKNLIRTTHAGDSRFSLQHIAEAAAEAGYQVLLDYAQSRGWSSLRVPSRYTMRLPTVLSHTEY
jgi:hypothetical protein